MPWFDKEVNVINNDLTVILEKLETIKDSLSNLQVEASEKVDNTPDNLQSGERFERAQERDSFFEEAVDKVDSIIDEVNELKDELDGLE